MIRLGDPLAARRRGDRETKIARKIVSCGLIVVRWFGGDATSAIAHKLRYVARYAYRARVGLWKVETKNSPLDTIQRAQVDANGRRLLAA